MAARLLTIPEAAARLGVVAQRVRDLARAGELKAIRAQGVWLIDADSLVKRKLLADLGLAASSARPWSQLIAWAAMRALDDDEALLPGLDRKARYRLRRRLDDPDPARLLSAVRNRARVIRRRCWRRSAPPPPHRRRPRRDRGRAPRTNHYS